MKKIIYFILAIYFYSCSSSVQLPRESKFLNFSDVHFDPFYDTTLVGKLIQSEYTQWESIYESSEIKSLSSYGSDSNFPLFKSAMEEMRSRISDPDFIIITGDFMGHNFNEEYEEYSGIKNTDSLDLFIKKTIQFCTAFIVKHFPNTVIFPMVGNDDSYCGNYMVEPNGDFLKMLGEVWEPLVNKGVKNKSFEDDFSKGGYCLLDFPGTDDYKLIILNTIFFSSNYQNLCGDSLDDPGADELVWLERTLKKCRDDNDKVWISYHIPPGIDIYGTINGKGDCEQKIFPTWKKKYNDEFLKIMTDHDDIIKSGFAGHFHRDDFRIFYENGSPVSYIHLTPSISPIYQNNPAYQVLEYDKSKFELINYKTYYLNDITGSADWTFEYDFQNTYRQSSISANTLNTISKLIFSDSTYRKSYIELYTSRDRKAFPKDYINWKYNWCGFRNLTVEDFAECICKDTLDSDK